MAQAVVTSDAGGVAEPDHSHAHATNTGVSNPKLAMWLFLSSEALFFGAFISTYFLYRGRDAQFTAHSSCTSCTPSKMFNIPFTSVTSFILVMSSLSMVLALDAMRKGDHRRMRVWLLTTAMLGAVFVGGQVFEFTEFYRKGLHLGTNMFGTTFYLLTGLHGMHVLVGIIWLVLLFGRSMQGRLPTENSEAVEISGLYWHFVDIVWIFIFTAVYLIPQH
jgi:cytochrome c oxidase subunit 3/cytochrome o ubiquinol oxidase subunit 3